LTLSVYIDSEMDETVKRAYAVALKAAQIASEYLMKRFSEGKGMVSKDTRYDVKLDVDVETEELIKRTVKRSFSDHGFLCEESGAEPSESAFTWVIDPLDGTVNFSRGIPHFCTSIALQKDGEYLFGVVHDPIRGETFSAIRDIGPTLNGVPIVKRGIDRIENAVVAGGFFHEGATKRGIEIFSRLIPKVKKVRLFGSAAIDLCYVSVDRFNGYLNFSTNEWDVAAASLIVSLAGAKIEKRKHGEKIDIIAGDPAIFDDLRKIAGF
jgi:myo-inositol-1(or 4)-monophosphatase